MKKKPAKKVATPTKMTADDHRKQADRYRAKSRLHEAKADMLDVDDPPKAAKSKLMIRPY